MNGISERNGFGIFYFRILIIFCISSSLSFLDIYIVSKHAGSYRYLQVLKYYTYNITNVIHMQ